MTNTKEPSSSSSLSAVEEADRTFSYLYSSMKGRLGNIADAQFLRGHAELEKAVADFKALESQLTEMKAQMEALQKFVEWRRAAWIRNLKGMQRTTKNTHFAKGQLIEDEMLLAELKKTSARQEREE